MVQYIELMTYKLTNAESDLIIYSKLCGLEELKPGRFRFEGREYNVHVQVNDPAVKSFGHKKRACKLLRYAEILQYLSARPEGAILSGMTAATLNRLAVDYPLLASQAEAVKLGATAFAWVRQAH